MLRKGLYIGLMMLSMACKTKQVTIDKPLIKEEEPDVFPEQEIAENIKTNLTNFSDSSINSVYYSNHYTPIWKSDTLIINGIQWIKNTKYHGLNPNTYNISKIEKLHNEIHTDTCINTLKYAQLDILLTSSIKKCGLDIRFSQLDPKQFHSGWNYPKPQLSTNDSIWVNSIKKNQFSQLNSFFEPKNILYSKLTAELKKLYNEQIIDANFQISDPGFLLQKGDSNKYVIPLKRKLLKIPNDSNISMDFNQELSEAVKKFQLKHGLVSDGIVGKQTYHYINWNKETYINLIKANLERLRWFTDDQFTKGININIASQLLDFRHKNKSLLNSKVVVGKYKNQTPVFQSSIDYLVFNPCWTVPKSIATTQILNGAKRDSLYLQKRNMFACINGNEVPTDSIDFSQYTASNFPFTVFQHTSPSNALGKVKFMFKNHYSIYLHDTPQQSLFKKPIRTYSHGCIRVENALQLADFILNEIDHQNIDKNKYLKKGFPIKVYLKNEIPINIVYITCWIDSKSGEVVYGKDVYLKDHLLYKELSNKN